MSMQSKPIPDWLEELPQSQVNPPVQTHRQELPFGELAWVDFEKLCLQLIRREANVEHYQIYGEPGEDQGGIDLYARKTNTDKYTVYQCKNEKNFGPKKIEAAVTRFLEGEWVDDSETFVLCTRESLAKKNRADAVKIQTKRLKEKGITFIPWDSSKLCVKLKDYPEIVYDFFGQAWVIAFCGPEKAYTLNTRNAIEKLREKTTTIGNVETLYVPPVQFEAITSILQKHHVVCIVGEPHMGKTFTATYLLWTYYRNSYVPQWKIEIPGIDKWGEISISERYRRSGLSDKWDIPQFIKPNEIVYFEDPFGRTSEEELQFANKKFDLTLLLDILRDRGSGEEKPPKVIITSRRAIFERVVHITPELQDFIVNINEEAYDKAARLRVLTNHIAFHKPKWSENDVIYQEVVNKALIELIAPHNLAVFVERSKKKDKIDEVLSEILRAKEIVTELATQISLLHPLSQLVFVTVYITNFKPAFQSFPHWRYPPLNCFNNYQDYAEALGYTIEEAHKYLRTTLKNWGPVLISYGLDTIGTENQRFGVVEFQHPSYAEATVQFIKQKGESGVFSQLSYVVKDLYDTSPGRDSVAMLIHPLVTLAQNLPRKGIQNIKWLFKNGNKFTRNRIVEALLANYHRSDAPLQNLFDELNPSDDKDIWYLFMEAAWPNPNLSFEHRVELWRRALSGGAIYPPNLLFHNPMDGPFLFYRRLPTDLQQIVLIYFESRHQYGWLCVAYALVKNYKHLPEEFQEWLPILASEGDEYVVYQMLLALMSVYEQSPNNIQDLVAHFGKASNWKYRAYTCQMFWNKLESLQPEHAKLIKSLALRDTDARVRLSVIYSHLGSLDMHMVLNQPEPKQDPEIFDRLFYSETSENEAGVIFSLFHTFKVWKDSQRKDKYLERFLDLISSEDVVVIAMIKYEILQEDYPSDLPPLPQITLSDSELLQYKEKVTSIADGLLTVWYGPGH